MSRRILPFVTVVIAVLLAGGACGGEEEPTPEPPEGTAAPPPAPRDPPGGDRPLQQTAERWAQLFASGDRTACDYWFGTPTTCTKLYMKRPLSKFVRSFRDASVKNVKQRRNRRLVMFSNGARVMWVPGAGAGWFIDDVFRPGGAKSSGGGGSS